jgi:hypothetical protein
VASHHDKWIVLDELSALLSVCEIVARAMDGFGGASSR